MKTRFIIYSHSLTNRGATAALLAHQPPAVLLLPPLLREEVHRSTADCSMVATDLAVAFEDFLAAESGALMP